MVLRVMGGNCSLALSGQSIPSPHCITMCSRQYQREGAPGVSNEHGGLTNCKSSQIVHRVRAKFFTCFRHHNCGSESAPVKGRDVTRTVGRNSKMADFQQDVSWDLPLPSGSKRAA